MYNVLEKLRSGEPLSAKEKVIHEQGLVSVLKQIHDDLDAAVFAAYGWPTTLTDEEILERLVALNAERAEEESRGLIRWLRPEFQNPSQGKPVQTEIEIEEPDDEAEPLAKKPGKKKEAVKKVALPKKLSEQVLAIRQQLTAAKKPITAEEMAARFAGKAKDKSEAITELLQSLVILGTARKTADNRYISA